MRNTSLFVCLALAAMTSSAAEPGLYKPYGQKAFDFWYAKSGETYHACYLQRPDNAGQNGSQSAEAA